MKSAMYYAKFMVLAPSELARICTIAFLLRLNAMISSIKFYHRAFVRWIFLASLACSFFLPVDVSLAASSTVFREDRVIIKPKPTAARAGLDSLHAAHRANVRRRFDAFDGLEVLTLPVDASVSKVLENYRASGLVEFAEPDFFVQTAATPNDPFYQAGSQWHLNNTGLNGGTVGADIHAETAWDTLNSASNIVVAIVDSGIRQSHEDLAGNLWHNPGEIPGNGIDDDGNGFVDDVIGINAAANNGNPVDLEGHGTQVAGVLGAVGNNALGVSGVAWKVQMMICRFHDDTGLASISDAVQCIDYARGNGAKVINASWGSTNNSSALLTAITSCRAAGIIFVVSSGNSANNNDVLPYYPANFTLANIVTVAATTRNDSLAFFSNYGATSVDLAAPGLELLTTHLANDASYASVAGTSFSAPMVVGAFALMLARYPSESYLQVIQRVFQAVDPLTSLAGKCVTGGRLNLARALGPSLVAAFDASPTSGSPPLNVTFTDRSFGSITNWDWSFGDGASSSVASPAHSYSSEGVFTVSLSVKDTRGNSASYSTNITIVANYQIGSSAFAWIDPSSMPSITLANDGVSAAIALPFEFKFYGQAQPQIFVGANGIAGFSSAGLSSSANLSIPDSQAPNAILCPFWDDLNPAAGGQVRAGVSGSSPNRRFVISWVNVPYVGNPPATYTFQIVLEETTHRILFQYQSVVPGKGNGDRGKSATIGIENASGNLGVLYSFNGSTLLSNNTTLVFTPPAPTTNGGVLGLQPASSFSASGTVGGPFTPSSTIYTLTNSGGASLNWSVSKSQSWLTLSATSGTLAPNGTTNITVSLNAAANTLAAGSFSDTVQFSNTSDGSGNTSRSVELTVTTSIFGLSAIGFNESGQFQLILSGAPSSLYIIESSVDLNAWNPAATNSTAPDGHLLWIDPTSSATPSRFYRARRAP